MNEPKLCKDCSCLKDIGSGDWPNEVCDREYTVEIFDLVHGKHSYKVNQPSPAKARGSEAYCGRGARFFKPIDQEARKQEDKIILLICGVIFSAWFGMMVYGATTYILEKL